MNIERLTTLRDQLKRLPPEKFNMNVFSIHPEDSVLYKKYSRGKECGTVACIAGWACLLNGGPKNDDGGVQEQWAKTWLEIYDAEAENLFYGYWADKPLGEVTLKNAIKHLDGLINEAVI